MSCSDIISIIDIAVSAGVGIWVATAIAKGQTKERFLKEYFTHELISIKEECKVFFDDICYDQKSANDIKTGFKILSMRAKAFEDNLREAFKNSGTCIHSCITKIQIEITNSDEFNDLPGAAPVPDVELVENGISVLCRSDTIFLHERLCCLLAEYIGKKGD